MKHPALIFVLALSVPATAATADQIVRTVHVMQRYWSVIKVSDSPEIWKAVRDNNNLNPFGPPAALRTVQATRAIELATSCRVVRSTMYQNMSAEFYSQVDCN